MALQIVVEDAPDIKSGYSLQFRFAQNPFFSNAILEKRCAFYDDGTAEITGTQPDWYPGKVAACPLVAYWAVGFAKNLVLVWLHVAASRRAGAGHHAASGLPRT